MTTFFRGFLLAGLFGLAQSALAAGPVEVYTDANGVAITGHDAVAYFSESKAVAGSAEFSAEHKGATYHFASAANRDAFQADPDKYAPQYGGFCAFGTTFKKKVPGDPQAFEVVDGKLYINSSPDINKRWGQDIPGNVSKADGIWPTIVDKDPAEL